MLIQDQFVKKTTQSEDEFINLGWVEALQWVLGVNIDNTEQKDQYEYPELVYV